MPAQVQFDIFRTHGTRHIDSHKKLPERGELTNERIERGKHDSETRNPDGGYPADICDVTDGIGKLCKSYN